MGREETWITRRESKSGPGRAELPPKRPAVAAVDTDLWDDEGGSAGVREPRRPKPSPLSCAGELPEPEPEVYLTLSDARR